MLDRACIGTERGKQIGRQPEWPEMIEALLFRACCSGTRCFVYQRGSESPLTTDSSTTILPPPELKESYTWTQVSSRIELVLAHPSCAPSPSPRRPAGHHPGNRFRRLPFQTSWRTVWSGVARLGQNSNQRSASNSSSVAIIGRRPTNSGISPYCTRSSG